jgi:hypothetical protein
MSKAEELADAICRIDTLTEYQRELIAKAAAELRRLAALEQAAEPVAEPAWRFFLNEYGRWEELSSGVGTPLYTHPARKPMTEEDVSKWQGDHDVVMSIKAYRSLLKLVGVERNQKIKE